MNNIILLILILLILLILIKKKKERFTNLNKFNKTIYVYWDKGVEGLPPLLYTISPFLHKKSQ